MRDGLGAEMYGYPPGGRVRVIDAQKEVTMKRTSTTVCSPPTAALRERLQRKDIRLYLPWAYVQEFHRALDALHGAIFPALLDRSRIC